MLAEQLGRWDTVGIDCVAMNVNDIVCVGSEPLAMVDYLAVDRADSEVAAAIGVGLARGAELAGIEIVGGELAQLGELINGLDLAGACFGVVQLDSLVTGAAIEPGDPVIGLPVVRAPLERLHARALGAVGDPSGRRPPWAAARRRPPGADGDIRETGRRAAPVRHRGLRPRPHHLRWAQQPAAAGGRRRLRDRRPAPSYRSSS